eukprot:COSAG05_NODE_2352_length_3191_cov_212.399094_2_plen_82_part_00
MLIRVTSLVHFAGTSGNLNRNLGGIPPDNTIIEVTFARKGELGLWFGCSSLVGPKTVTGEPSHPASLCCRWAHAVLIAGLC